MSVMSVVAAPLVLLLNASCQQMDQNHYPLLHLIDWLSGSFSFACHILHCSHFHILFRLLRYSLLRGHSLFLRSELLSSLQLGLDGRRLGSRISMKEISCVLPSFNLFGMESLCSVPQSSQSDFGFKHLFTVDQSRQAKILIIHQLSFLLSFWVHQVVVGLRRSHRFSCLSKNQKLVGRAGHLFILVYAYHNLPQTHHLHHLQRFLLAISSSHFVRVALMPIML